MKNDSPKLSIVLGTYNRLILLKKCLRSLLGDIQTDHRIIIIDAGSTDGTLEYLHRLSGRITLIREEKIGQIKSINHILKSLHSTYICWISDDNILQPGMVDTAIRILDDHVDIGMVALKVKDVTGPYTHQAYIGGISPAGILNVNQGVLRLDLMKQVGYFDEAFPDYGMDVDLTTKILLAGKHVVYTKDIAVFHYRDYEKYPGAFATNVRKKRLQIAERIYRNKYLELCTRYPLRKLLFFRMVVLCRLILFLPIHFVFSFLLILVKWTGYPVLIGKIQVFESTVRKLLASHGRDWNNILRGQYISLLDLWYNRTNDYYLVQKMNIRDMRQRYEKK